MNDDKERKSEEPEDVRLAQAVRAEARADDVNGGGGSGGPNGPPFQVALTKPENVLTPDHAFWGAIRNRTEAISFDSYSAFINRVLCSDTDKDASFVKCDETVDEIGVPTIAERKADLLDVPSIYGVDAYNLLKVATQAFLLFEAGVAVKPPRDVRTGVHKQDLGVWFVPGEKSRTGSQFTFNGLSQQLNDYLNQTIGGSAGRGLPYLRRITDALLGGDTPEERLPFGLDLVRNRFSAPSLLELIWSYWHEEGMLVQTMNAICMRFQNRRGPVEHDPLANLEIDSLRPLNNLLWGYIQDEYNRLTVPRRAYEYDHQYGLKIMGKAVPELRSADSRSKFIEAFHNLLYRTAVFYRADADTTVIADGFPLLNSLREVHLLLAEGAHNQFGDLPWTSRAEMLMMQWLLGRSEMREFLRGRAAVPYQERWMGQVDTMNRLQGWNDTSITHFRNLATYGEQILLSVRYGDWIDITDQDFAKTWARYWRSEVQAYIHAYLAATGVDLSEDTTSTRDTRVRYVQPSILLQERALAKPKQATLPPSAVKELPPAGGISFGAISARRRRLNPAGKD